MTHPREYIEAYTKMVTDRLENGFSGTFATIMFNELGGSPASQAKMMENAIYRLYGLSLTYLVQYRGKRTSLYKMPFWLVCADFPIHKSNRDHIANISINNGRHLHGVMMLPPKNRLSTSLAVHFAEEKSQTRYHPTGGAIQRIVADPITHDPDVVVDYTLKSLTRHRVEAGDILVLPRTHDEVQSLKPGQTPRDVVNLRRRSLQVGRDCSDG